MYLYHFGKTFQWKIISNFINENFKFFILIGGKKKKEKEIKIWKEPKETEKKKKIRENEYTFSLTIQE